MMPYIIQSVFILLSPALFSASVYVILGRIVRLTEGESHILIKKISITKVFLTGDLICLFMQCAGKLCLMPGRKIHSFFFFSVANYWAQLEDLWVAPVRYHLSPLSAMILL